MKEAYNNYDAVELAQEPAFIAWVQRSEQDASWQAWLASHPGRKAEADKARQLVEAMEFDTHNPTEAQVERMWSNIDSATVAEAPRVPIWQRRRTLLAAAAAAVLLILAGWWILPSPAQMEIRAQAGERQLHELPDGSLVTLNARSILSYQPEGWQSARQVKLAGEAFFEVEKGTAFVVQTALGEVRVLGTSFNVDARGEVFAVACYTGSVQVYAGSNAEVILPGQRAMFSDNRLEVGRFVGQKEAAWREGMHYFEEALLSEVFREMERQYDVVISYDEAVGERSFTGFFESGNLEEALEAVCWPMGLKYAIDGQTVTVQ